MKSYLIKDTTKEERIELIRQWVPADEAMEDCEIDLWDMYHDYINGIREIAEINAIAKIYGIKNDESSKQFEYSGVRVPTVRTLETAVPFLRKPHFRQSGNRYHLTLK